MLRMQSVSVTKANLLMLSREKQLGIVLIHTFYGQNAELLKVELISICSNYSTLEP